MRNQNWKSGLGFAVGIVAAAGAIALADGTCCAPAWKAEDGPDGPCTGTILKVCEQASATVPSGKGFASPRNAICKIYNAGQNVLQADCTQTIPGWTNISPIGDKLCCFVPTTATINPGESQQSNQITPCNSTTCEPNQS